ncbi:hypothetical protein [Helicobacter bilis]|uniref:hypothetical protein n=1 Tax=Helicobacter bilis TaxID=37372 RepID=UPI0029432366|nr:hypothetical protein [Helicobacter bilis]
MSEKDKAKHDFFKSLMLVFIGFSGGLIAYIYTSKDINTLTIISLFICAFFAFIFAIISYDYLKDD